MKSLDNFVQFYDFLKTIKKDVAAVHKQFPVFKNERNSTFIKILGKLVKHKYDKALISLFCKAFTSPMLDDSDVAGLLSSYETYYKLDKQEKSAVSSKENDPVENSSEKCYTYKDFIHGPELVSLLLKENIRYSHVISKWVVVNTFNRSLCYPTYGRETVIVQEFRKAYRIGTPIHVILNCLKGESDLILDKQNVVVMHKTENDNYNIEFSDCIYDMNSDSMLEKAENLDKELKINDSVENFLHNRKINEESFVYKLLHHMFGPVVMWDFLKCIALNLSYKTDFPYFIILSGVQNTGKSTLLKFLMNFLGEHRYVYVQRESELSHEFYMNELKNKNFCFMDDIDFSQIAATEFRQLTKGSLFKSRAIYGAPEQRIFTSVFVIANNYVPTFTDVQGLRRRCLVFSTGKSLSQELLNMLKSKQHETDEEKEEFLLLLIKAKQMISSDGGLKFSSEFQFQLQSVLNDIFLLERFISENYTFMPNKYEKVSHIFKKYLEFLKDPEFEDMKLKIPKRSSFRKDLQAVELNKMKLQLDKLSDGSYIVQNIIEKEEAKNRSAFIEYIDNKQDLSVSDDDE